MSYSFNEVETTAKKAARGVGYPWGHADEIAKSARWLCGQSIDGCAVLARHLESADQIDIASQAPVVKGKQWQAINTRICPALAGTALSDQASLLDDGGINLQRVSEPLLLLYFAALIARHYRMNERDGTVVGVSWSGTQFSTDGVSLFISGSINHHNGECSEEVIFNFTRTTGLLQVRSDRAKPTKQSWQTLNNFALRTYAPATEVSRLAGAGAGLSDND